MLENICTTKALTYCGCGNMGQGSVSELKNKCSHCDGCSEFVEKCKSTGFPPKFPSSCFEFKTNID
ncbi:hypothetical protein FGIG_04655 [Fasciola gigantica]|uniref:Uncharacterized protein n=1 Tax=Fasciola gigantica TaxID=46835 RepID=A0A504Y7J0_FASGI|nr:hypothetical protein FGIG_04655 [Fasciola gigantica]